VGVVAKTGFGDVYGIMQFKLSVGARRPPPTIEASGDVH